MDTHRFLVREISKSVQSLHEENRAWAIYHGPSHTLKRLPDRATIIRTTDLHNILNINMQCKFALVEPNVTISDLVQKTLNHGLMPIVVPSFPSLTVGGCFAGTAAGSGSSKFGYFDQGVAWVEVVLADGRITRASRTRNVDLLEGLVGSLGTVGIVTLLQVRLVPAARFVEVEYFPIKGVGRLIEVLERAAKDTENDFVEGLMIGVVVVGRLFAKKGKEMVTFSNPHDRWFYMHALEAEKKIEKVRMLDYLFRHDRGAFCLGETCFGRIPFRPWTRWATDSAMREASLIRVVQELQWADHLVMQDVVVPVDAAAEVLDHLDSNMGRFPLALCPVRQWPENSVVMRPNPRSAELCMSITVRGWSDDSIKDAKKFRDQTREVEKKVYELGGIKWLYSRNYYSEEEFWNTYSKEDYDNLRSKYNAGYLPSVYHKSKTPDMPPRSRRAAKVKVKGFWNQVFTWSSVLAVRHRAQKT
ncbi:FAD-binding domain-containing protein [Amniculicola lignicola CBS 123094]|uniref:Delta(24)-sterol reductase n=1 Tax=Amniculicola lignicola CBS 123094 TaxID=1392246 RepID=A0A6A5WFX4_9PLEO|nr:FAD-binding domain-containing protein [Amniculicola lignicola CBS 123094]